MDFHVKNKLSMEAWSRIEDLFEFAYWQGYKDALLVAQRLAAWIDSSGVSRADLTRLAENEVKVAEKKLLDYEERRRLGDWVLAQ
jgi:hypothetical protein